MLRSALKMNSRDLSKLESGSVHLVLTSPPYWTLKEYREASGQLGAVADYERFVAELDRVWRECFRLLAPGGRLVCVVGDVLLSRRRKQRPGMWWSRCTPRFRRTAGPSASTTLRPSSGTR